MNAVTASRVNTSTLVDEEFNNASPVKNMGGNSNELKSPAAPIPGDSAISVTEQNALWSTTALEPANRPNFVRSSHPLEETSEVLAPQSSGMVTNENEQERKVQEALDIHSALNELGKYSFLITNEGQTDISLNNDLPKLARGEFPEALAIEIAWRDEEDNPPYLDDISQRVQDAASYIMNNESARNFWIDKSNRSEEKVDVEGEMSYDELSFARKDTVKSLYALGVDYVPGGKSLEGISDAFPITNNPADDLYIKNVSEPQRSVNSGTDNWQVTATYSDGSQINMHIADNPPAEPWNMDSKQAATAYATHLGQLPPGVRDILISQVNEHHLGLENGTAGLNREK